MMNALHAIHRYESGDLQVLKSQRWLMHLALTREHSVNLERIQSLEDRKHNYTLQYVKRSLDILEGLPGEHAHKAFVEQALQWAEAAKAGLPHHRAQWIEAGCNLAVHNEGSACIYLAEAGEANGDTRRIVHTLIATHGLIGQYLRGEVLLSESRALHSLVTTGLLSAPELSDVLMLLNRCVIAAVSPALCEGVAAEVRAAVELVARGNFAGQFDARERLRRLRTASSRNGEDFEREYGAMLSDPQALTHVECLLDTVQLWYVEGALYDFSFEQFIKVLLLAARAVAGTPARHLSFEPFMQALYYERQGRKHVNFYRKRVIEHCLTGLTYEDILAGAPCASPHAAPEITLNASADTAFFTFRFSSAGSALMDFCVEAERSDVLYEKAVLMLFDFFGLRRDRYDRFHEEAQYLATMNSTIDHKSVLLEHIAGSRVLDIGPGGGALMDLIEERLPHCRVTGVDISQNVVEELRRKKQLEHRRWDVIHGDALDLAKHVQPGQVDTVIFCSILHELFSYIPFHGRKFNHETIAAALRSAFEVLSPGGRILIRDGIMTEPEDTRRIIRFRSEEGLKFLRRYAADFQGRPIGYETLGRNEVSMFVNDAMEFLYTYTWGEPSYVHEVQEQFGYFTPTAYQRFIEDTLGSQARILELRHYLQDGYALALSQKIELFDEAGSPARLPDSTCLIVIEKAG